MQKDNITPFKKSTKSQQTDSLSLRSIYDSIQSWRQNKKKANEKIPEAIWDEVFILLDRMDESRVLTTLGLSTYQLIVKGLNVKQLSSS